MKMLTNIERSQVLFLNVIYGEHEKPRDIGAMWDKEYKKWYVPLDVDKNLFSQWFGISKDFFTKSTLDKPLLYIDLVPSTTWYSNLYKFLKKKDWDIVRHHIYEKSNHKCEICDGIGKNGRVDAHERWEYDDIKHIQKLKEISCLCPACHRATHLGFAEASGFGATAKRHLKWINKWSRHDTTKHVNNAFNIWDERSNHEWLVDVTWLIEESNISISEKSLSLFRKDGEKWIIPKIEKKD